MPQQATDEWLQCRLIDHGYDPGLVDGTAGDETGDALRAFQAAHGWTPDGIVTDREIAALGKPPASRVNIERDRRIAAGTTFEVTGYGAPIHLTGRARDQIVYMQRLEAARSMIAAGDTETTMVLRDGGDVNRHLTAPQMAELITLAVAWVEAVMQVSWDMKDANGDFHPDGIPEDFADDAYWP